MDAPQNAVPSLGNQGSQDFDAIIASGGGQQPTPPTGPQGENIAVKGDQPGAIPTKTLPKEEGQPTGGQPAGTQSPAMSQADIIKATADAVAAAHLRGRQESQAQAQPPTQAELSPEEFNKKFNVTRANEELVATILSTDPKRAAAALDQYGQNLVRQAVLMTIELADAKMGRFQEEVKPHITSWQAYQRQQQAVAAEGRFFASAPDLKEERDLVMELKDAFLLKVQSGQVRFANEQEAFSAVANAARTILKKANPSWGQGSPGTPTTGQTERRMSVASSTGRSGTPVATAKSDVDLVFGADAR